MFETSVGIRYADLDTYGHVNNAVYATLLEEARLDYFRAVLGNVSGISATGDGPGIVLANLELEFERPLGRTGAVTVGVEVPDLGESSIPFRYEIRDDGAVVATAETTVVVIDRETGRSQSIPEPWRDRIDGFEG